LGIHTLPLVYRLVKNNSLRHFEQREKSEKLYNIMVYISPSVEMTED
jgi:hypothetical protein